MPPSENPKKTVEIRENIHEQNITNCRSMQLGCSKDCLMKGTVATNQLVQHDPCLEDDLTNPWTYQACPIRQSTSADASRIV